MNTLRNKAKAAFTLLELSVVILIIGLVVGAIFAGQSILRSADLQSVMTDVNNYTSAVKMFRDKYKELPGDFPSATNFWGAANADPALCPGTVGSGTQTCNGDGNGFIGYYSSPDYPTPISSALHEPLLVWQHLANAGLIPGSYAGATEGVIPTPAISIPKSRIPAAGYYLRYAAPGAAAAIFDAEYGHVIVFGQPFNDETPPIKAALSATEAYELDKKMDDGLPGRGHVLSMTNAVSPYGITSNCATGATANAEYNVNLEGVECTMFFITGM